MKSIAEATWKDAAVIEARSLLARLDTIAGTCAANPQAMLTAPIKQDTLESVTRQAVRLAELIDKIDEVPPRRPRGQRAGRRVQTARARFHNGD